MSEPRHHTKEVPNIPDLNYYYCMSCLDGYGGFNWSGLIEALSDTYWQNVVTFWCDTGYQNVAAAAGASAVGYIYEYGTVSSARHGKETFDLKSFVAAAAWSANMPWTLTTYHGDTEVGSMNFTVTDAPGTTAQLIKVNKLIGTKITSFTITMDALGSPGNTCTYGKAVEGYQMAFDKLTVVWNGKIPTGARTPHHVAHQHHSPAAALLTHQASHAAAPHHQGASHHTDSGYHSQLQSLHHDVGALTTQFNLPQAEHLAPQ